jgi:hypothetical protein
VLVVACLSQVSPVSLLLASLASPPQSHLPRVGPLRPALGQELRQAVEHSGLALTASPLTASALAGPVLLALVLGQELRQAVEHSGLALAASPLTALALAGPVLQALALVPACCHTGGAS